MSRQPAEGKAVSETPEPINYTRPRDERSPVSVSIAHTVFFASCLPPAIGLVILAIVFFSGETGLAILGLFWLIVGGVLTAGTAIAGIVGWAGTFSRSGHVSEARRYFGGAVAMAIVSLLTAAFCLAVGGGVLSSPPFAVDVHNQTNETVDVTLIFDDGPISIGPILPGDIVSTGRRRHQLPTKIDMSLRVHSRVATTQVLDYLDEDDVHGGPVPVTITNDALPPKVPVTP